MSSEILIEYSLDSLVEATRQQSNRDFSQEKLIHSGKINAIKRNGGLNKTWNETWTKWNGVQKKSGKRKEEKRGRERERKSARQDLARHGPNT